MNIIKILLTLYILVSMANANDIKQIKILKFKKTTFTVNMINKEINDRTKSKLKKIYKNIFDNIIYKNDNNFAKKDFYYDNNLFLDNYLKDYYYIKNNNLNLILSNTMFKISDNFDLNKFNINYSKLNFTDKDNNNIEITNKDDVIEYIKYINLNKNLKSILEEKYINKKEFNKIYKNLKKNFKFYKINKDKKYNFYNFFYDIRYNNTKYSKKIKINKE